MTVRMRVNTRKQKYKLNKITKTQKYLSPFIHVYTERKLKEKLSPVTFFYCSTEGIKFSHDEYEKNDILFKCFLK